MRSCLAGLGLSAFFLLASTAPAQDLPDPKKESLRGEQNTQKGLTELKAEVDALQLMYDLKLTVPQLKKIREAARKTAGKFRSAEGSKSSKEYFEKLEKLRDALGDPTDDDAIEDLLADISDLVEADEPTLNHRFDLTRDARKEADLVMRSLTPKQLAHYLGLVKDDLIDPRETLIESLSSVRGLKGKEWKKKREEIAEDVAGAAAGIDDEREAKINDRALALLIKAHALTDDEFKKQQPELEKEARQLFGDQHGIDYLRHEAEYAVAKLLSNPQLVAALERRLKKEFCE